MSPKSQACTASRQFFNNFVQTFVKIFFTTSHSLTFNLTHIVKYTFSPGKIKETFYQAKVVFGVLFYDSVCSVEATLATNEIDSIIFVDEAVLSITKA